MEVKFKTMLYNDKELIIFEREDFEAFLNHIKKLNTIVHDSIESYFGQIDFQIDETFVEKHRHEKKESCNG
jgi:hypothetical protein